MSEMTRQQIEAALAAPFDQAEVKWKPKVIQGNRALALCYVDARVIQDRLDEVLGVTGWQDDYEFQPDGSVLCRLKLRIGGEWLTKVDVGGESEQPDGGDRKKAAVSDALKRAAVKWGVGRYLYRIPGQWVDYDPHKRQFLKTPTLPPSASVIGTDGAKRLKEIADRKGEGLAKHLAPFGISAESLTREQANEILERLKRLPDLPSPEPAKTVPVNGKPSARSKAKAAD